VWGCSYAGATSTWLKEKYPQLFTAAVGGSSPLLAKLEYYEYDQTVAYSLNLSSPECLARAQEGTAQVQKMAEDPAQVATVGKLFNTCTPIKDVTNFMNQVYNPIAYSTQYNESPAYPRDRLCQILTNQSMSAAQALAAVNLDPAVGGSATCLQLDMLHGTDGLLNTSNAVNYRKWFWQKCTQLGYFKVAPAANNVVSSLVQLPYFLQACQETFGINGMSPDIFRTNNNYGGNSSVEARRVLAPNG
jgi:thymus-specific serine protease